MLLNTYLFSILAVTIQFEVFAHFCSKLVDIRSGWSELSIVLAQGETQQLLEWVLASLIEWCSMNFGSVFILYNKAVILSITERHLTIACVVARFLGGSTWVPCLFDLVWDVLRVRDAIVIAWWMVSGLGSHFGINLSFYPWKLERLTTYDDQALNLTTIAVWLTEFFIRIGWLGIFRLRVLVTVGDINWVLLDWLSLF